jgi:hypothetical protein
MQMTAAGHTWSEGASEEGCHAMEAMASEDGSRLRGLLAMEAMSSEHGSRLRGARA